MPSLVLAGKVKPDASARPLAHVAGGRQNGQTLWVSDTPGRSKIDLDSGFFIYEPPHDPKARFILAAMAASGSGKSTQLLLIAERYHTLYPKRPICLVSRLDEDETLDQVDWIRRIRVDTLLERPFELKEFGNDGALLIVDDIEGLAKDAEKSVQDMLTLVLTQGRHYNVSLLFSAHNLTNGAKTRTLLNEAMAYCVFPHATSFMQMRYLLERYAGLDRHEIAAIRKLPSRWVIVGRRYPSTILTENSAYLPHSTA